MAERHRRLVRSAFPRAAARGADLHAAAASALFPGGRRRRQTAAALHHREQHRKPRARQGARRQRTRGAAAAVGRRVLLEPGSQAAARGAPAGARCGHVPGQARLRRRQGAPRADAGGRDRAAHRRRSRAGRARRGARQVRPAVRRWWASSRNCRESWAATTPPPTASPPTWPPPIDEHYLPRGAGGALPGTGAGVAVALADKLDTLAGIFAIGQKPSGTKDPFGLRRAAIGCAAHPRREEASISICARW